MSLLPNATKSMIGLTLGGGLMLGTAVTANASLSEGDTGNDVEKLQEELSAKGLYEYNIDGIYGPITENGVEELQGGSGLKVDGIVGPNTKMELDSFTGQGNSHYEQETEEVVESASTENEDEVVSDQPDYHNETMEMEATAYTANCAGCSGITATGVNLNADRNAPVIAADPDVLPMGTEVEIEGMGTYTVEDTGGAINGDRIDIHVPTKSEAFDFGRQDVEVTILD